MCPTELLTSLELAIEVSQQLHVLVLWLGKKERKQGNMKHKMVPNVALWKAGTEGILNVILNTYALG
jgi:hypothetical protein